MEARHEELAPTAPDVRTAGADEGTGRAAVLAWLAAIGASSCCVIPLLLVLAGLGGAWVGTLTSLAPWQPLFLVPGFAAVGWGLWRAYRRPACADGTCERPMPRRLQLFALWGAAVLLVLAATSRWWMPLLLG